MSAKTLDAMQISNPAAALGASGTIRYYADQDFTAFDGTQYLGGAVDSLDYFLSNTWSIAGGDLIVPSIANFPSTDDAIKGNGVRITAAIYNGGTKNKGFLFDSVRIYNSLSSPLSLTQLVLANNPGLHHTPRDTETATQEWVIDYVNTVPPAVKMTAVIPGIGRLSLAAANVADPIVVGDNDPRITAPLGILNVLNAPYNAVADAIILNDGAMAANSNILTSASAAFTAADVGKLVDVQNAGVASQMSAIITGFTSSTEVTVSVPASYTVAGAATVTVAGQTIGTGSMTAGSATLTTASGFFHALMVGQMVKVTGVGSRNIAGTITGFTSATQVTLSVSSGPAANNVSGAKVVYGTDNATAINAAITAALATGAGQVFFPAGNYAIGSALAITGSDLTLAGAGMYASNIYQLKVLNGDLVNDYNTLNVIAGSHHITFDNLGFSGTNWNGQTNGSGGFPDLVYIDNNTIHDIIAVNCRFDSSWDIGFHNGGSIGLLESDPTVVRAFHLYGCSASFNAADGFNPNPRIDLVMVGCTARYNGSGGVETVTSNATLVGNQFNLNYQVGLSYGGYGGGAQFTTGGAISGNVMSDNGFYGLALASNAQQNEITGNTFINNHYANIFIDSALANYNHLANNVVRGNVNQFDILCSGQFNLIEHNFLYGAATGNVGISIVIGASGNILRDNYNVNHPSGGGNDYLLAADTFFSDPNPTAIYTLSVSAGVVVTYPAETVNQFSVNAGNGARGWILTLTELTTIAAAATTDTAIQIPAGAIVLSVAVRTTIVIPTAATYTVTGTSSGTFNTAAVSTAANATNAGTAAGAFYNATAQTIRITPNLTPAANTGRVRVSVTYYLSTPATS